MKKIWLSIKLWVQTSKIRNRYFATMILMSIIPLAILGFISFNIAKNTLVENQLQSAQNLLKASSQNADLLLRNVINMERLISWNENIQQELKLSLEDHAGVESALDVSTMRRMENLIDSYFIDKQNIDSICLFDAHYRSVCYGDSASTGPYDNGGAFNEIVHEEWFVKSTEAQGKPMFFSENVLVGDSSNDTFSSVKLLRESDRLFNQQTLGMLVVNVKKSIFGRVFNESGNSQFIILDESGKNVRNMYSYPASFGSEPNIGGNLQNEFQRFSENGYFLSSFQNRTTGWTFIHIIKEKELFRQSHNIGKLTAVLAFLMALISLSLSFVVSGKISMPLLQLKKITVDWAKAGGGGLR